MKRFYILIFCLCMLCGCKTSLGSLSAGTLDMDALILAINEESNEQNWDMMLLQDRSLSDEQLQTRFGLTPNDIVNYGIYPSIIPAVPDEIMIFEASEEKMILVEDKVKGYIDDKIAEKQYLKDYKDGNIHYKEIKVGNYYIVVFGKDAQLISEFIQECA